MECRRKVLLVPKQQSGAVLQQLRLPNPRTGELSSYYADAQTETILEAANIDMKNKRSWLAGDWTISDGSAAVLTHVDPLFIYLALLTKASMSGDNEWRFVDIDNMLLESHGSTDAESIQLFFCMREARARALEALCTVRQISSDTVVVKIDAAKVMAWLKRKCDPNKLPHTLAESTVASLGASVPDDLAERAKTREIALLVAEYLPEYWTTRLFAEHGGFAGVCSSENVEAKRVQAMVFDSPDSYVQGVASPSNAAKLATKQQEKPKTAKEKQLERAAKKSKSITSFFQKKPVP
ncbi:hypothetical protein IW140_002071 [Coemansia sp. RSA 1813]|nr:hypothetical protein EV178_000317 [Coemansia sp. RSA 1646]KAJ1772040.1 hypothetical protein LPJ74_001775 [Coemansia sp. RSA 1843]KAJ2090581.1 hypothetical protein IW138_002589 [Coemansia sp. RSA 986]KAJ2216332.1 hypothetical protein EV179_001357 [Coemansia sp. RSA 487]KAJ2570882.1 hypothetical protein IW140_002071 [Coemansia sp. RSA 1813]